MTQIRNSCSKSVRYDLEGLLGVQRKPGGILETTCLRSIKVNTTIADHAKYLTLRELEWMERDYDTDTEHEDTR